METDVRDFVQDLIGPFTIAGDHTRRRGRVIAVRDADGRERMVKTARSPQAFRNEVHAYRHWAPALGDEAPRLLGSDPASSTLVTERLPGCVGLTREPAVHREAGRVLARFHAAESAQVMPERTVARAGERMLRRRLGDDPESFDTGLVRRVERSVGRLVDFEHLRAVPTHGDYGAQNWLRSPGRFCVIDFEHSCWNAPVVDFARLYLGPWWGRPELVRAFFRGYGRTPTVDEVAAIRHLMPIFAVGKLARGVRQERPKLARQGRERLAALYADGDGAEGWPHLELS